MYLILESSMDFIECRAILHSYTLQNLHLYTAIYSLFGGNGIDEYYPASSKIPTKHLPRKKEQTPGGAFEENSFVFLSETLSYWGRIVVFLLLKIAFSVETITNVHSQSLTNITVTSESVIAKFNPANPSKRVQTNTARLST